MPNAAFIFLATLIMLGDKATRLQACAHSGYEDGTLARMFATMRALQWIERRSGFYWITERGKIAHAIESGRRTWSRSRKLNIHPMKAVDFERIGRARLRSDRLQKYAETANTSTVAD